MSKSQQSSYLHPPTKLELVCRHSLSKYSCGWIWELSFCYGLDVVSPLLPSTEETLRLRPRTLVFDVRPVSNGPRGRYIDCWIPLDGWLDTNLCFRYHHWHLSLVNTWPSVYMPSGDVASSTTPVLGRLGF